MNDTTTGRPSWLERPGACRTRNGRKVIVLAVDAPMSQPIIGVIAGDDEIDSWFTSGRYFNEYSECETDLTGPWVEPVDMDESVLPRWANWYVLLPRERRWIWSDNEPMVLEAGWNIPVGLCGYIPAAYAPKWSGDWRESKTRVPRKDGGK